MHVRGGYTLCVYTWRDIDAQLCAFGGVDTDFVIMCIHSVQFVGVDTHLGYNCVYRDCIWREDAKTWCILEGCTF